MGQTGQSNLDSAIELHPEMVKQRQDTYSSLTDLYGVDVFSDVFQESMDDVYEQIEEDRQWLETMVFVKKATVMENYDTYIREQLFTTQEETVLSQNYMGNDMGVSLMDVSLVLIGILAVTALYLFLFSDKKARRNKT